MVHSYGGIGVSVVAKTYEDAVSKALIALGNTTVEGNKWVFRLDSIVEEN